MYPTFPTYQESNGMDLKTRRYVLPMGGEPLDGRKPAGEVMRLGAEGGRGVWLLV